MPVVSRNVCISVDVLSKVYVEDGMLSAKTSLKFIRVHFQDCYNLTAKTLALPTS